MNINMRLAAAMLALPFGLGLLSAGAMAADITEAEPNNTLGSAQHIDDYFSNEANPDVQDAAEWPWVSISGSGDGTNDYYAFEVPAPGVTGVFDIDYGYTGSAGSVDTELCLFAADGTVLASSDDSSPGLGAGGSNYVLDSYISYAFASPGTYIIGVGEYNVGCNPGGISGNTLDEGDTYELQVSLDWHVVDTDGDGVADDEDINPYSDLNATVVFEDCDSGVANTLLEGGCTIADLVHACADDSVNHGSYASCVAAVTNDLKREGVISGSGKGMIQSCAAQSDIGK